VSFGNYWDSDDKSINRSPWPLVGLALCLVFILALRLFSIQVLKYDYFIQRSEAIRIKREVIEAPRGYIYDRNGQVLAENEMSYSITVDPFMRESLEKSIAHLHRLVPDLPVLMNVPENEMVERVKQISRRSNNPEKIIRDADFRLLSIVEEYNRELEGLGGTFDQLRHYPHGPMAAHVIGYMGELTREEYERLRDEGYGYGHSIGKYGIERYYEDVLKGKNGSKFVEMNYLSRKLDIDLTGEVTPVPPVPGDNLTLTLDIRLQAAAQEAFGDTVVGALVALDPTTGDVLAMVSLPSFDPNEFTHVMTRKRLAELMSDPDKPMFNRAIQATYPPGSTFKMLTAIAGLENGVTADMTFRPCRGSYFFGRTYECWKEGGHGPLDMYEAIGQSCNVYFYQLGRKLGIGNWYPYGDMLGLGKKTGIDLFFEESGTLPSPDFYKRTNVGYSPGMMLNLAIGQGENLVTMIQLAHYVGVIAAEGLDARPHLVMADREPPKRIDGIAAESFTVVKEGMFRVVHGPHGTARSARVEGHHIAGKTGTAQNPHGAAHKLFVAFAPYEEPRIAIACVAENADDYAGSLAVKIVNRVLREYFLYYPDDRIAVND